MTDCKSGFDHMAELLQDEERAFHVLGPVWGSPPRLFEAKLPQGQAVYASVIALLDHIEADDLDAEQLRAILASCQAGSGRTVKLNGALFGLSKDVLEHVFRVFAWVADTGGIGPDDFDDGGLRFRRVLASMRLARSRSEETSA